MRFRGKIFLAVLVPAALLVAGAVAVALDRLAAEAEEGARRVFERTQTATRLVFETRLRILETIAQIFASPRYHAMVLAAVDSEDLRELERQITTQLEVMRYTPDFYCIWGPDGKVLVRRSKRHRCEGPCPHPLEPWVREAKEAFVEIDGGPFVARTVPGFEEEVFLFGSEVTRDLDRIRRELEVELVAAAGDRIVHSTRPGLPVPPPDVAEVRLGGERYKVGRVKRDDVSLILFMLHDLGAMEARQRRVLLTGALAFLAALGVAALAGSFVARGISRPVEALVDATRKVGEGDYTVKVDIPSRDEMGRLGCAFNDMTEGLRKRQEIMEKTLSRDVAEELLKGVELGGERVEVTILFMDVRGFTSATEGVDPVEVVATLNDMMTFLAGAIHAHGGNVNKYLGDGLMAMFGAPKPLERHELHAVRAALEMQRRMDDWRRSRPEGRLSKLQVGIGINAGSVVGGKVGSRERLEYTLIGEEVNLASRVCGKAAPGQVLVTRRVWERVRGEVGGKELEPVQVKGLSYPVSVFEVFA